MCDPMGHAVRTARAALDVQSRTRREEYRTGLTIVRKGDGRLAVYPDSAWTMPSEAPLLSWPGPPAGRIVARVALDGSVQEVSAS